MQSFVDYFYDAAERDGATIYSKSDQKKTLLLMHVLMAALILQGFNLGVKRCEQLRQAVKLTPTQFSALYRYASCGRLALRMTNKFAPVAKLTAPLCLC